MNNLNNFRLWVAICTLVCLVAAVIFLISLIWSGDINDLKSCLTCLVLFGVNYTIWRFLKWMEEQK
jgi:hypothetical protein